MGLTGLSACNLSRSDNTFRSAGKHRICLT